MFELSTLDSTLWLAEPGFLRRAVAQVARMPGCPTAREVALARRERLDDARQAAVRAVRGVKGKVGVIPIHGPIEQRATAATLKLGGTSTEEVGAALDVLLSDAAVEAIILHVDSGGGSSYGVEELGEKLYEARGHKPLYAMVDSLGASAAFWLASAAENLTVTPGGDVGSVGVYALHVDQSKALEEDGLKVSLIRAGKFKAEGNPFEPLAAEARTHIQEQVDYTHSRFIAALARNRGVSRDHVRSEFGQGRLLNPNQALAAKMVDRVGPFQDLLSKLTGGSPSAVRRASAEVLKLRHQQRKRLSA